MPTENPEVAAPNRLSLKEILWHFLHFRLEVITNRLSNELRALEKRIHILNGFAIVFDALDEIIRIIRRSDGKSDSAQKIMKRFPPDGEGGGLDEEQTDAILELKLYRLAKLEINVVLDELKKRKRRAREIRKLLAEDTKDTLASGRWRIVREEIEQLVQDYGKDKAGKTPLDHRCRRRTRNIRRGFHRCRRLSRLGHQRRMDQTTKANCGPE